MAGNQALNINYYVAPDADLAITGHGSDWYWTVCALFTVSTLALIGLSLSLPVERRTFHHMSAGITLVSAIAYYAMAAGLGQTPVQVEFPRPNSTEVFAAGTREVFYARYINWFATTPLIVLGTMMTAGLRPTSLILAVLAGEVSVVTGLLGALTDTTYKWGFAVFGFASFLYLATTILGDGRRGARTLGGKINTTFTVAAAITVFTGLVLYPIAWGLSEGGNVIHPDSEAIFYGILDLLTRCAFPLALAHAHRTIDPIDIGLGARYVEKTNGHANGFTNGRSNGHANGNTTV